MADRELLELAGKAAGVELLWKWSDAERASVSFTRHPNWYAGGTRVDQPWNPLVDDGDALRLAVQLRIEIHFRVDTVQVCYDEHDSNGFFLREKSIVEENPGDDLLAVTRELIVRAAAEIGKTMLEPT